MPRVVLFTNICYNVRRTDKKEARLVSEYVLPEGGNIVISGDAVGRLLGAGSGDAALLYIHILAHGGRFVREDAATSIHRTPEQVDAALDILSRTGLVSLRERPAPAPLRRPDELPQYTPEDVEREIESGGVFPALVHDVQMELGSQLSSEGLMTLFGIYDYLRLPPEVILMLVNHCVAECEERYGQGRRPSMRYIEKAAYTWERENIFSIEAAEGYIKRLGDLKAGERELAPVLGISNRPLSATERKYLNMWTTMGFRAEAVGMAYDRTVTNTGRLAWKYMDSILKSWHSKGLHTPEEIAKGDSPPKVARPAANRRTPSGDVGSGQVTAGELERMREKLRQIKGES